MTWIEAKCPECGTVECSIEDFELAVCEDPTSSYYTFWCPVCETQVQRPADEKVTELLISEGVTPTLWRIPAEMREPRHGPELTTDDLLDFHILLQRDDWFSTLQAPAA